MLLHITISYWGLVYLVKLTVSIIWGLLLSTYTSATSIVTEPIDGVHDQYCLDLLRAILSYDDEAHSIAHYERSSSQNRNVAYLQNNIVDVIWIATSEEYEQRLLPIRIPLFKGLLGQRLLVINKADADAIADVSTIADLKRFSMGQGLGWIDAEILRSNGFTVRTAFNHEQLYSMLKGNRFDALPRGLHEPWEELEHYKKDNLVVEQTLILSYTLPMYFFVNKENQALANLIESNFKKMIDDGAFEKYFLEHPKIRNALEKSNLSARRVISLKNPFLPKKTPLSNDGYWYNP
ncbi:transporter substrate-binding domain-containing protein [Gilvimarinus sp. SDUM040013]|uniref:Transporter substrate-binding domain-containing protein n=1 Tax=Gilvimarinus gilvus TaxID=3058038 RepID=A0ABU4S2E2_9GAMM|nr:transporter substrate-binding domain-containing protein [Gilvimarinus sp. SDUM040013]MDO3387500.1 transporter substrate-binding domain-containing protein [Gilvimarinus sp. SDUM040013]MDX6851354.1 transporter substrate-binding domain-containing protein [Gilvimarinus sp. SDUM040013]